jgi:hypothetical protein
MSLGLPGGRIGADAVVPAAWQVVRLMPTPIPRTNSLLITRQKKHQAFPNPGIRGYHDALGVSDRTPLVLRLLQAFFAICLLRSGPQDLPASRFLFWSSAAAGVLVGTLILAGDGVPLLRALLAQGLDQLLMGVLLYAALSLQGRRSRFLQGAAAVFGSGLLVNLALIPLLLLAGGAAPQELRAQLAGMLFLLLLGWSIVILGHILRNTFDLPFGAGVILALGYFLLINQLVGALLGP